MTLTTHTPIRRCGKRYASAEAAEHSKTFLAGGQLAVFCAYGCDGWHLEKIKNAPTGGAGKAAKASKPAARDTGPDRKTRALVLARDGYACVCCGHSVIGQVYSLQHRKRRSQGGGNSPANLLTVLGDGTRGCHARIDSRIDPHDEAAGYTVRSTQDPALIGVLYVSEHGSGVLMYLGADGSLAPDPPVGQVA